MLKKWVQFEKLG